MKFRAKENCGVVSKDVSWPIFPPFFHFIVRGYASSSINVIFPITINTSAIATFPKVSEPCFLFLPSPLPLFTNCNKRRV